MFRKIYVILSLAFTCSTADHTVKVYATTTSARRPIASFPVRPVARAIVCHEGQRVPGSTQSPATHSERPRHQETVDRENNAQILAHRVHPVPQQTRSHHVRKLDT